MTDRNTEPEPKSAPPHWSDRLAVWRVQLLALAGAPFVGIGFIFDFSLRAKDFPELASAMWGVMGLFIGLFLLALSLVLSGILAAILGAHDAKADVSTGWKDLFARYIFRFLFGACILSLLATGYFLFIQSADGFGSFVQPYVHWLRTHSQ